MRVYTIILIILIAVSGIRSQVYNFRTYSLEEGLSQSQIYDFCQDVKGNMWISTYSGGITIYDGHDSKYITVEDGIPGNYVVSLHRASNEYIWIGTTEGICYYDGVKFNNISDKDGVLKGTTIWDICEGKDGGIWIASNNGLWIYKNKQLKRFLEPEDDVIYLAYKDKNDVVWFHSTKDGVFKYANGAFEFDQFNELDEEIVNTFFEDSKGNFWLGTSGGLVRYKDGSTANFTTIDGLSENNAYSLQEDEKGRIWIGTYGSGLSMFDGKRFQNFTEENGLCLNKVNRLLIDDQNNLWIGTDGGGASILKTLSFGYLPFFSANEKALVMSVFCDSKDNIWFGSEGKGIVKYYNEKRELFSTYDGLTDNSANCFFEDHEGNIWIGSDNGLNKYSNGRIESFNFKDSLYGITIMCIYEDKNNTLWLGTNGEGIFMLNDTMFKPYEHEFINDNAIWSIEEDSRGKLFICTEEGLGILSDGTLDIFTIDDGLTNSSAWAMDEDKYGNVWIGTDLGVNRYNGSSFRQYKTEEGLTSNTIYIMKFDDDGYLWIGSEKGVDRITIDENGDFLNVEHYGKKEGFRSIECNSNAISRDKYGRLWFGTIDGVIVYDPAEIRKNTIPPKVHITNVRLFYENVNWTKNNFTTSSWYGIPQDLVLPYDENTITIEYIGINFFTPEKVKYRYKLEGLDTDWAPVTTKNYERYSNLPPGKYTFKLIACNEEGVWSKQPVTFSFEIKPPFWKTIWFYVLVAIVGALIIYAYINFRTRKLKRTKDVLSKMVRERTYEIVSQKEEIDEKRKQLELAYKDITDSVKYAQNIQNGILPDQNLFQQHFPQSFIMLKPKDIVSGDFYWFAEKGNLKIVAAVDCTGHGVPGAFMSLIGNDLLNQIIVDNHLTKPSDVLNILDRKILSILHNDDKETYTKDGMDLALVTYDSENKTIEFSGSYRPFYMIRDKELMEIKGNKFTAGGYYKSDKQFTNHTVSVKKGDCIYIFSDGYADQFGGEKGMKFMIKRFKKVLLDIHHLEMSEQKEELNRIFEEWKDSYEQIDDVLIIGIQIT